MKKLLIITFSFILGLYFIGCKDETTPSYQLTVQVKLPDGFTLAGIPEGTEVKVTNLLTGREKVEKTDATGKTVFNLTEGNYRIVTSFSINQGKEEYSFNGLLVDYMLVKQSTEDLKVALAKNTGGFIIKEIYFSGSLTPQGKRYYADQFHEIYNNSGDTLYADGLCIGVLDGSSTKPSPWTNVGGALMDSLALTFHAWMIPGTGKEHRVLPGESILIAQDGINHKTDENGNPESPVNLGNADWESYVEISGKDLDAPGVPNLTMMYTNATRMHDWLHSVQGSAEIIFRLPTDWKSYVANENNFKTRPGSSSKRKYFMIDKKYVIDAVEIVKSQEKNHKRLPVELDAGYVFLEGGTYCSKSIRRKARMIVDGRVIYKDTNNTSEDFLHDLTPTPKQHPTVVED